MIERLVYMLDIFCYMRMEFNPAKLSADYITAFGVKVIIRKDSEWPSIVYQWAHDLETDERSYHSLLCLCL